MLPVQEFPVGKKFYKCEGTRLNVLLGMYLSRTYVDSIKAVMDLGGHRLDMHSGLVIPPVIRQFSADVIRCTNDFHPVIRIVRNSAFYSCVFTKITTTFEPVIRHKIDYYHSSNRVSALEYMPLFDGMEVSYDIDRGGIIIHNMPYEGPLVKDPAQYPIVNRAITSSIRALKDNIKTEQLLLNTTRIDIPGAPPGWDPMGNLSSHSTAALLAKHLSGESTEQSCLILACKLKQFTTHGIMSGMPNNSRETHLISTSYNYKWLPEEKHRIYFSYGAFKLPEDYLDWFEK